MLEKLWLKLFDRNEAKLAQNDQIGQIMLLIWAAFVPKIVDACPAYVYGYQLQKKFITYKHEAYLLSQTKSNSWEQLPLQIDMQTIAGAHDFSRSVHSGLYTRDDRFSFPPELFGEAASLKSIPTCKSRRVYELIYTGKNKRYAYLVFCRNKLNIKTAKQYENFKVDYDPKKALISSENYQYFFNQNNYMLFNKIHIGDKKKSLMASDSRLFIHSDLKNFFSLSFDDEVVSKLRNYRIGPMGLAANINFYLEILFFKVKLALVTDVNFYYDSVHIPMKIHAPYDTNEYLNPGSGIMYHWKKSPSMRLHPLTQVPFYVPEVFEKKLQNVHARYCRKGQCEFLMVFEDAGDLFTMRFILDEALVKNGFYPVYVDDTKLFKDKMDWPEFADDHKGRAGFFFATQKLGKGDFAWDFWIKMQPRSKKPNAKQQCPKFIASRRI